MSLVTPLWSRRRTVVVAGKRGVGKSSTLNALFGFDLPTDAAVECTVKPSRMCVEVDRGPMAIVDMPGIAANLTSAARFDGYYKKWLRRADLLVWITQADVRAYKKDQQFFLEYSRYLRVGAQVVIAISKFDTLCSDVAEPLTPEWSAVISEKIADLRGQLEPYCAEKRTAITYHPYSLYRGWNTRRLVELMACGALPTPVRSGGTCS
jgi:predicted GTPase